MVSEITEKFNTILSHDCENDYNLFIKSLKNVNDDKVSELYFLNKKNNERLEREKKKAERNDLGIYNEELDKRVEEREDLLYKQLNMEKENELLQLTSKYDAEIQELNNKLEYLEKNIEIEVDRKNIEMRDENIKLKTQNDIFIESHKNIDVEERIKEALEKQKQEIEGKYNNTSIYIGKVAEDNIEKKLREIFPDNYCIKPTGKEKESCDIHINNNLNDYTTILELKNEKKITKNDIDKFYRDIELLSKKKKLACGVFISLITDKIPNKPKFFAEKYKNIPLIFMSFNGEENLEKIVSLRIRDLHMIFEALKSNNNENDETITILNSMDMYVSKLDANNERNKWIHMKENCENEIKRFDDIIKTEWFKEINRYCKEKGNVDNEELKIIEILQKFVKKSENKSDKLKKTQLFEKIKEKIGLQINDDHKKIINNFMEKNYGEYTRSGYKNCLF